MVAEEGGVGLVHGGEVGDVGQVHIHLHDVFHRVVDRLDDGLHIGEALGGLLGDGAVDELAGQIERQLGGDVVVVREGHGLGGKRALRSGVGVARLDDEAVTILDGLGRRAVAVRHDSLDGHVAVVG